MPEKIPVPPNAGAPFPSLSEHFPSPSALFLSTREHLPDPSEHFPMPVAFFSVGLPKFVSALMISCERPSSTGLM